tara:strand:+ start:16102 stop:18288 length:2187 start_codon:yes stop_codon:yes gene_type:complete
MDFETYSSAGMFFDPILRKWKGPQHASLGKKGLGVVGTQVYAEHPSTEVLVLAYDLKDGIGRRQWQPGDPNPQDLFTHIFNGKLLEAWNVMFEERIWNEVCVKKYGWPPLPTELLRCAMAKARAYCFPGKLSFAGPAAGLPEDKLKLKDGARLLTKFSVPRTPTKKDGSLRNLMSLGDPDSIALCKYNDQDIVTEHEMSIRTPDLNSFELQFWQIDQDSNRLGVKLDMEAIDAALKILNVEYEAASKEIFEITNGEVETFTQNARIVTWLQSQGVHTSSVDADHIASMLAMEELPPLCRRVLELRSAYGSASVKKLKAMKVQSSAVHRATSMFVYHGARTGRDAGAGIQPQNMPNSGPDVYHCPNPLCNSYQTMGAICSSCGEQLRETDIEEWSPQAVEHALWALKNGTLNKCFPKLTEVLAGCLRGLFIADEGHDFIGSDYSAIEAVVAACLTGCQWRIDTFARKDDIYLASISAITGTPIEEYKKYKAETGQHHPDRKKGKVAELASGYGGWIGAWKQFGADDFFESDSTMKDAILAWRKASPEIVDAWGGQSKNWKPKRYGLEGAFLDAIENEGTYIQTSVGAQYLYWKGNVYCFLPSGRYITYHNVRTIASDRRKNELTICFWGYNTNPKMGAMGWVEMTTYGGKLFENIVQAVARDLMAYAAVNLHNHGYKIMLRVHDELITQVPEGTGSVEQVEQIGSQLPEFAKGWPVRMAGGWRGKRFRK